MIALFMDVTGRSAGPGAATHLRSQPRSARSSPRVAALCRLALCFAAIASQAGPAFQFPTANRSLLEPSGSARFFAPTAGRTWTAGQFGCVRSDGWQMHEGIDILFTQKDRRGEPTDEVRAAADGEIAYVSRKPGLSNYGIYAVLRHRIEGLEVYTVYAHLRQVRGEWSPGASVRAGDVLGVMGRTTNTKSPIGKDRAHLHFEITLLVNPSFSAWLKQREPDARDDHGMWNGRNLLGIDPAEVFREQQNRGARFSLLDHVRQQRELFRVYIADTSFPWLKRYPQLIRRNPTAERDGIVGYEVSFNFNGLPFRLVPRSRTELNGPQKTRLLSVDEAVYRDSPCRKLVFRRGQSWTLTAHGDELISLLVR
ncbi:MAG: M23 family metallopeptidase [Verrucomicrobiales bacterium]|nr:M23 family metallopeptidase [Verrucomicrobiales bacterium]